MAENIVNLGYSEFNVILDLLIYDYIEWKTIFTNNFVISGNPQTYCMSYKGESLIKSFLSFSVIDYIESVTN